MFLEIDPRSARNVIEEFDDDPIRYRVAKAKAVLAWVAQKPDIAEIFADEDDEFDLLKALLEKVLVDATTVDATTVELPYQKALNKTISTAGSFVEIAINEENDEENEAALKWVHDFFYEMCYDPANREVEDLCVFRDWYCKLDLSDENWKRLLRPEEEELRFKKFEYVVDEVLNLEYSDSVSFRPDWWTDDIGADELEIHGLKSLCDVNLVLPGD